MNFEITSKSILLRKTFYTDNLWSYNSTNEYLLNKERDIYFCPKCSFTPSNWPGDSTFRDVIVTFCFGSPQSVPPFIRMLRTVKCRAKIVIIADEIAYQKLYKYSFSDFYPLCDVIVYNIGQSQIQLRYELYQMKTLVYREFLSAFYYKIDRIMMCDLADTAFQSDPFKYFMHEDSVYNYIENITIEEEDETFIDIQTYFQDEISEQNYIVTPAAYFGNPVQTLKLLDLVQSYFWDDDFQRKNIVDQSIISYLYYTKKYQDFGINMKALNWTGGIISANLAYFSNYDIGSINCMDLSSAPFLIHHTNYIRDILLSIYKTCPRIKKHKGEIYLGDLDRETMESIDAEVRRAISLDRKMRYNRRKAKIESQKIKK
ncbi:hypothetical protein TVAG_393420 [Trichomonas vaginalis G3]|uniref:Nucleotide-diphospho-sugar transferase domain-containing protein n=1 Tax=Trichomonas vaginalis (strain ATCC PRA-98 / G3) TaxID=412133 RepID=A2DYD7_TRIV3|nr:hypothetical protein TVAGG3_0281980 [Trichomonas vaginalis G3]EAY14614.1 hypothetical protein TVAG_393420 [Trichomonas vaginalis G3]KAI5526624.1 hypothetical protein TVAGG3_0281980 [Trichomonas vaginalis G3]|eukprot:XP_001326837.1 hypothetical protein [Trichomonas vaginalis G3]